MRVYVMEQNHQNIDEVMKKLKSSSSGLSIKEIHLRWQEYGKNILPQKNQFLLIKNIVSQFSDLLVIILIVAGVLSWLLGDTRTAIVMFCVVFLNALIGFWQQYKTERVLIALKNILPPLARVVRDGKELEIAASEIVPGDMLIVQAGDAVPADGMVFESYSFKTNESSLTGESNPQAKHSKYDPHHPNGQIVFMGTTAVEGQAKILVTSTGTNTEFGKIAMQAKSNDVDYSVLQKKLRKAGKTVSAIAVTVMILMIAYQLIRNRLVSQETITPNFVKELFLFGLALAAALVPEGLPATVSVALSIGAGRLAKKKAVVKKLSSVETLGGTQVICTDKTGTLTFGKMSVISLWPMDSPEEIVYSKADIFSFREMLNNWATCHNVKMTDKGLTGDPNEVAIFEAMLKKHVAPEKYDKRFKRIHEYSFTSIRKMMSVVVEDHEGFYIYSKGNPAILIEKCKLNTEDKTKIISRMDKMASRGIRVLAFAHRELYGFDPKNVESARKMESDLIFDGLIGIEDDIRPEVLPAIDYCHKAGIRIIMITGDYKVTAESTANKLNISNGDEYRMISGDELYSMNDLELRENLLHASVFYQTDPSQKLRIVSTLQNMGLVVAVTGDGINDALALKKADIGVAMGKSGTDVAREAADMVLLDDNFATIVNAVLEGRIIWNNLKRVVYYIFSSNAGEFMTALLGVVFGLPLPLLAVQVLSVDLGTDVLPSIALTGDVENKEFLTKQQTAQNKENLLGISMLFRLLYVGIIMGGGAVLNFWLIYFANPNDPANYAKATAAAFATLVVCQIVNIFTIRGGFSAIKYSALAGNKYVILSVLGEIAILLAVVYLPSVQSFLSTGPLSFHNWLYIIIIGILFLAVEQLRLSGMSPWKQIPSVKSSYSD